LVNALFISRLLRSDEGNLPQRKLTVNAKMES
jgi:hypothetical protein